jgi:hypothetical protein
MSTVKDFEFEVNTVIDDIDEIARFIKEALAQQRRQQFRLGQDPLEVVIENDLMYEISWLGYDLLSRRERLVRIRDGLPSKDYEGTQESSRLVENASA